MTKPKKLAIIDGKSVFYRGYYALSNLSTKDGTPTGGVFGFATMAFELIRKLEPDYVAVAWDKPKTNIRKRLKIYPEYKAGRKPAPPDFYQQIPLLQDLLKAFGWPLYELDDYEADDIMGTLAVQARAKGLDTALITSDLDMLQVINGNVHVYALKRGFSNIELFRPETFIMKYGIKPEQFLDLKALKGDSSDNIPGVAGIGEKTAIKLLREYQTLDEVYKNIDQIPDKFASKLKAGKDMAYLSKKIAQVWTDAPIKLKLDEVDGSQINPVAVADILHKLELRTLAAQVPKVLGVELDFSKHDGLKTGQLKRLTSLKQLQKLDAKKSTTIYVHSFAAGKHGKNPKWLLVSFNGKTVYALSLENISAQAVCDFLKHKKIIGHDTKKTLQILLELGAAKLPVVEHDVMIASFVLDSLRREWSLTELAKDAELDIGGSQIDNLPPDELMLAGHKIIALIKALYDKQSQSFQKQPKLKSLNDKIECPIIPILAMMEHVGIKLDVGYLNKMSKELDSYIEGVEQKIYKQAGKQFNINSPAQLADILFTKLNLPTQDIKKTKTGHSTAASELDKLRNKHPIIELITNYREYTKLKNTYIDTLPRQVDGHSRLHTTYNMATAPTGRLSSIDPNLQNIPVRTELGKRIRTAFTAGAGNLLINADYSQQELRIAACLSGDARLIDMFNRDIDVHTATAAEIYGRKTEDVTKNMRHEAKAVNFGVMYGLSPHGLAEATGMTHEAAKHFIDKYFQVRPKLLEYIENLEKQAKEQGYTETLFGRRRPTPDVKSSNFAVRKAALRAAINMPFQGSAADIMKLAMISVQQRLDHFSVENQGLIASSKSKTNPKILLQIHDSLIVECPEEFSDKISKLIKQTMEKAYKVPVKLTVETTTGKNWGEL